MLPKIEDLNKSGRYRLLYVLNHMEIADFVSYHLFSKTFLARFFINFLLLSLFIFLFFSGYHLFLHPEFCLSYLQSFVLGLLSFFLMVPFHELIHGFMYKFYGAPKVKYGVYWSKLAFFAVAPEFVVSKREFIPLAIAPFIIISTFLIILLGISLSNKVFSFYLWGIFLIHSLGCAGDFALIGFFEKMGKRKIYTYDDSDSQKSYFYEDMEYAEKDFGSI